MVKAKPDIDWVKVVFLIASPIVAIGGTIVYACYNSIHPVEIASFLVFFLLTEVAIGAGYHRYFAHRTYECHWLVRLVHLVVAAGAWQNSALPWASAHRRHHKFVDTEEDPYSIRKGALYAHMGWIFIKDPRDSDFTNAQDLLKDPLVVWQDRYYTPLMLIVGLLVPTLIGLAIGRPLGGFLWGGLLRIVVVHHMIFCVNSVAHLFGTQPYSDKDSSRDSWWLAYLTSGEGYHNFHHAFPGDYRNGVRWYHWDPSKWWVSALTLLRLTDRLNRTSDYAIAKARLQMEFARIHKHFPAMAPGIWDRMQAAFLERKNQLEVTMHEYYETRRKAAQMKKEEWQIAIQECKKNFEEAKRAWHELTQDFLATHAEWANIPNL